ncbi:asparagine synthase (glutamine-hydrolyzing), partial [Acidobacteria bacterium ACD]|nr:asparagine synthase (glutamine-hydrolyzing) [Acidobacteria bacterium ACD]
MCGIVAIHAYDPDAPRVDREEALRIREAMAARGPDGHGYWESDRRDVALGHRRLAILDPSDRGAQPMRDPTGRFTIVFNGEIYNFKALRAELESRGHVFRTGTDTEVLLALYAEHGPDMLGRLRGMYALALWDEAERSLALARDPYGIKPLYLADDGQTVRAASQVRGLLAGRGVEAVPDPAGVVGFCVWGHVPEPFTLHRGIRALAPGEVAIYRQGTGPRRARVAHLVDALVASQRGGLGDEAKRAPMREALLDSVRHHLESDVPVGLFLSAGLDSRAIARLCRDAGADVLSVTLGFSEHEGTPMDEVPVARQVASSLGIRHEAVRVTRSDFDDDLDAILAAMDQPSIDGVNTWFVSRAAASLGLKVALSGLGGDELFGGYPSFYEVPRTARALSPFTAVPAAGRLFRRVVAPLASRAASPKWASVLEYGGTLGGAYFLRRGLFMPWELPEFLDADLVREGWEALGTLPALEGTVSGLLSDRLRITALQSNKYMRNQLLRDADWAGMAHSLEIRVPFVDVELARRLAASLGLADPPTKAEMARAVEPDVPEPVLSRAKTGFAPPVAEWVRGRGDAHTGRGLRGWARFVLDRLAPELGLDERRRVARPDVASAVPTPGPRRPRRVLISTLPPSWGGGVPRMAKFATETVRDAGDLPVLAWYRPFTEDPYLSPTATRLGIGAVGARLTVVFDGVEGHELGAWLPELESNQYPLSRPWAALVDEADVCLAASGTCLAARPFLDSGRRFVAW